MLVNSLQVASVFVFSNLANSSLADIKNLMIKGGVSELGTGLLRLGDIADVTMGYQEPMMTENRYNGNQQ